MSDQMGAPVLPIHGHEVCQAPHLEELADGAVVFDNAYCNYPLCAPARFSLLAGRLAPAIGAYDNASEFTADTPTMAHYLSLLGYRTILCGKMHFIGPDQLHGFEERLTTDVYPASFSFLPDWEKGPRWISSGTDLSSVVEAGPCVRSLQIDYDDEVEHFATQKIYDLARDSDERPFFLCVSFTQPHSPYTPGREHWDRYRHDDIDMPRVPEIPYDDLDALGQGLYYAHGRDRHTVTDNDIRNARRGYYGMIGAIDDKIGRLLARLDETGVSDNTVVVFTTDHGDMMGERGMWYKHCFFEWSARVPLIIRHPESGRPGAPPRGQSRIACRPASDADRLRWRQAPLRPVRQRREQPRAPAVRRGRDVARHGGLRLSGDRAVHPMPDDPEGLGSSTSAFMATPPCSTIWRPDPNEVDDLSENPALCGRFAGPSRRN